MKKSELIPRIRFFETPQVFIALPALTYSFKYFWRHIKEKCPSIRSNISDNVVHEIFEDCRSPQTIKIQAMAHAVGSSVPMSYAQVAAFVDERELIRPCKLSTIARLVLTKFDDNSLPEFVTNQSFCLPVMHPNNVGCFMMNFQGQQFEYDMNVPVQVGPDRPLIVETLPLSN